MPSPTPGDSSSRSRSRQAPHCLLVHGLQKSTTRLAANYSFSESQEQARRRYCSNYAAERILLRKVGGGYIFIHRLLLEYFAGMQAEAPPSANASPTRRPHKYVQSAGA